MPNGTYGGVRGRKTKVVGRKLLRFPPTRFLPAAWCFLFLVLLLLLALLFFFLVSFSFLVLLLFQCSFV